MPRNLSRYHRAMKLETLAVHAGRRIDLATGAVTPPIHLATTFERAPDGAYPHGYQYARESHPNRSDLETCLCALEGGAEAAAFTSGSAATLALLQTLRPGDHVVATDDVFYGTRSLIVDLLGSWGLESTFVAAGDSTAIERALRPTSKLVWIETPSNPLVGIADIAAVAEVSQARGAEVVVDNTWATPIFQRPLNLGADWVLHSTTKYFGGHCDVLGGALVARNASERLERLRQIQKSGGAGASPFDSWLVLRGVRSLACRMKTHAENAQRLAEFLAAHPKVVRTHYPGLLDHPGHDIAARQMSGWGGMLSFEVAGGREAAFRIAAATQVFTRATSLGGVESLIEHRASVEGTGTRAPEGLLRVSVGLEHPDDLVADLERALSSLS